MRRKMLVTSQAVLGAGIIGAFFRKVEMLTIFDPVSGLAREYAVISILLVALSLLIGLKIITYAFSLDKNGQFNVDERIPFPVRTKFSMTVTMVIGVIVAVGSVLNYFMDKEETSVFKAIFAIMGILSGVAIIMISNLSYEKKHGMTGTLSCIITIFLFLWLVMTYTENNTNPALIEYCYKCFALAATTLSFYYAAGHYYGKLTPKRTVVSHFIGVYFCLVTVLDAGNIVQGVLFAALAMLQLINVCAYIRGMPKRVAK